MTHPHDSTRSGREIKGAAQKESSVQREATADASRPVCSLKIKGAFFFIPPESPTQKQRGPMPSASFRRSPLTCKVVSLQLKHFLMSCYDKHNQDCYSFDGAGLLLGHFAPDRQIPLEAAREICATPLALHRLRQSKILNWHLSIFTRPQKPQRVVCCCCCYCYCFCCCCCCYHHGSNDYCSLHCQPAPGRPGHGAGDSNYVI